MGEELGSVGEAAAFLHAGSGSQAPRENRGDGSPWGPHGKEAWASTWSLREWEAGGVRTGPDRPPCPLGSDILYPKDSSSPHSGVPAEVLCRGRDFVVSAQLSGFPAERGGWMGAAQSPGPLPRQRAKGRSVGPGGAVGSRGLWTLPCSSLLLDPGVFSFIRTFEFLPWKPIGRF